MIESIFIQNYTLIEKTRVNFGPGLNIITGETGSGKSLIFDAIAICLGDKTNTESLRDKEKKAIIEMIFTNATNELNKILTSEGFDLHDELTIRREINPKGNSRVFINDTPSNINFIKSISVLLIDFHRQNETISILKPSNQLKLLDSFSGEDTIVKYRKKFRDYIVLLEKLQSLVDKQKELIKLKEFNELKLKEIEEVSPKENELPKIQEELKLVENSEYIFSLCYESNELINGSNFASALLPNLDLLLKNLEKLEDFNQEFKGFRQELSVFKVTLKETVNFISNYKADIQFNPSKIEELRQREKSLKSLIKKYGDLDSIIELSNSIKQDLNLLDSFTLDKDDLLKQIKTLKNELQGLAFKIHQNRLETIENISPKIENNLKKLGIENAQFTITLSHNYENNNDGDFVFELTHNNKKNYITFNQSGIDIPDFLFSANAGNEAKNISEVASGGEVSRIMLSIKSIVENSEEKLTFIFDEIDTGISGKVARLMGHNLKELGKSQQIISITHLPQIASLGDVNFNVSKREELGNTISEIKRLSDEEKVIEIAKLIGGQTYTETSVTAAKELIEEKN